jgi:transposase
MKAPGTVYPVCLTDTDRAYITRLLDDPKTSRQVRSRGQVLLMVDESAGQPPLRTEIAKAIGVDTGAISKITRRYLTLGVEATMNNKRNRTRRKATPDLEACVVRLARSEPPQGHARWTYPLLSKQAVALGAVDSVAVSTVRELLIRKGLGLYEDAPAAPPPGIDRARIMRRIGMTEKEFDTLAAMLDAGVKARTGIKPLLSAENMLLATLEHMSGNRTLPDIAAGYAMKESTIRSAIRRVNDIVFQHEAPLPASISAIVPAPPKKRVFKDYRVRLNDAERAYIQNMLDDPGTARKIRVRCNILRLADERDGAAVPHSEIAGRCGVTSISVSRVITQYKTHGVEATLRHNAPSRPARDGS